MVTASLTSAALTASATPLRMLQAVNVRDAARAHVAQHVVDLCNLDDYTGPAVLKDDQNCFLLIRAFPNQPSWRLPHLKPWHHSTHLSAGKGPL